MIPASRSLRLGSWAPSLDAGRPPAAEGGASPRRQVPAAFEPAASESAGAQGCRPSARARPGSAGRVAREPAHAAAGSSSSTGQRPATEASDRCRPDRTSSLGRGVTPTCHRARVLVRDRLGRGGVPRRRGRPGSRSRALCPAQLARERRRCAAAAAHAARCTGASPPGPRPGRGGRRPPPPKNEYGGVR